MAANMRCCRSNYRYSERMKTLNLNFDDKEYKELREARKRSEAKSWEKWLLELARNHTQ